MDLDVYDLRDPSRFINDVASRIDLSDNTATLCLVKHPSTTQELVRVTRLSQPAVLESWEEASDELREVIWSWEVPDVVPPEYLAITVLVRRGRCIFTGKDSAWFMASRYCNHVARIFGPQELLVTEHGWLDYMTHHAGTSPALVA